jgi:ribulose-5-phosphate 4-epimerase/fuculose-1-phosphate aldolase
MELIQTCRKIAALKLVQANSGNLSERCHLNNDRFYITASGAWFDSVECQEKVACSLVTGEKIEKNSLTPSTESPMHLKIYNENEHIYVILHCQPVYATIVACARETIDNFKLIPEIVYYLPKISYIGYYKPGSVELAYYASKAVSEGNELVIMQNHGILVVGSHYEDVIQKALFFELACEILVKSPWKLNTIQCEGT